ncbi:hypothetical protein SA12KD_53 [Escherichia phage vB_EcoS_SA12KD]|nr:hypothetical protein SA12KD_53 [Escherichia phage vB_EcoS_SA12KD]
MAIKHPGLKKAIQRANDEGFIVYRTHYGHMGGLKEHHTKIELVDLREDYDTFQYIATSDVEAQVKYINDTIDSFRG